MSKFTAYSKSSGIVLYCGIADDPSNLESQDVGIVVGVERSQGRFDGVSIIDIPPRPSQNHIFSIELNNWIDGRGIEELKAEKNAAINAARLAANQSHFMFAGKQIAVDPLSRSDIDATHGAVLMLGSMPGGWPGGWKAKDNTIVPIPDIGTWGQFYGAMVAQGTANFMHAQALKAQLAAATTPEEVEAVPVW